MIPELLGMRHERMMQNPFSYFRATAGIMEADLRAFDDCLSHIPVIICGDSHLTNFGFFASPERQLLFGLNDFDEARIGNWEFDLKRLLTSIVLTGRINGFDQDAIKNVLRNSVHGYRRGIDYANSFDLLDLFYASYNINDLIEEMTESEQMKAVLNKVAQRAPKNNSDKVVKKFTYLDADGQLRFNENPPRARRVSPSLYAQLLQGMGEYQQSVSDDVRVLQTHYDPFLGAMHVNGRSFYVRQFRDMKDSIDPLKLDLESFSAYCLICSFIFAVAHYESPTAPMIYGYVHKQRDLDDGLASWALAYADQMERDYAAFSKYLQGEDGDLDD